MATLRRIAARLLHAMVQRSGAERRSWADAMLREMDFVESDWSALLWALGSTTVLCRHALAQRMKLSVGKGSHEAKSLKGMAKRMPGMLAGVAVAGAVLTVCVLAWSNLTRASWFEPALGRLADRMLWLIVPEAIYVASAAALWQRRRPVAAGILTAGVILMTHTIVHFATHG